MYFAYLKYLKLTSLFFVNYLDCLWICNFCIHSNSWFLIGKLLINMSLSLVLYWFFNVGYYFLINAYNIKDIRKKIFYDYLPFERHLLACVELIMIGMFEIPFWSGCV